MTETTQSAQALNVDRPHALEWNTRSVEMSSDVGRTVSTTVRLTLDYPSITEETLQEKIEFAFLDCIAKIEKLLW